MNANDENKRPEEIESELAQTRAQVSSTIDAIQTKLTPGQLMDQAVDYWRSSLPADFGTNLSNSVRQNPVPVTLIGIGLAWLMMAGKKTDTRYRASRDGEDTDYDTPTYGYAGIEDFVESGESMMQGVKSEVSDTAEQVKGKAAELKARASESAHRLRGKASEISDRTSNTYADFKSRAYEMRGRLSDKASHARERAGDLQQRSREQYYRARSSVSQMVDEQPLVIGAIGVAIGAALGASLPATRREDEWLGEQRDNLMERTKETAREYVEPMKESAQRVAETAEREIKRATGETPESGWQGSEPASSDDVAGTQAFATGNPPEPNRFDDRSPGT